jgi:hypothetical protein
VSAATLRLSDLLWCKRAAEVPCFPDMLLQSTCCCKSCAYTLPYILFSKINSHLSAS